jgi:hypothetical protein
MNDAGMNAALQRLAFYRDPANLPAYAAEFLKIKDKDGKLISLRYSRTQLYVHQKLEEQRLRTGKVRMNIGKGRQTFISTYIGARFYHRTTMNRGIQTYILTHEQTATDKLFEMVSRFQEHNSLRPHTGNANAKELVFDVLDGGYSVGTAGTKALGRSSTNQLLHWSEVAFSPNGPGHNAGVVQTVPDRPGTEIIKESTGCGPVGEFYESWQQAEQGKGDYGNLFAPWFWNDEYQRVPEPGFTLDGEEALYKAMHGLSDAQMCWRRAKIAELRDSVLFKQEYPATSTEMFEASGKASYITPESILAARKATRDGIGPLVVGVDPARDGDDRFSVAWRRGRKVRNVESRLKIGTTEALAWLRDIIDQDKPAKMFIDAGGGGDRLYDILVSWGKPYSDVVGLVNFGGKPQTEIIVERDGTRRAGPLNRRSEMYMRSKDWLEQEGGVDLPDMDSIQADACLAGFHYSTRDQQLVIESKEQIRSRTKSRSPDEWDAIILTFAEPVREKPIDTKPRVRTVQAGGGASASWMGT